VVLSVQHFLQSARPIMHFLLNIAWTRGAPSRLSRSCNFRTTRLTSPVRSHNSERRLSGSGKRFHYWLEVVMKDLVCRSEELMPCVRRERHPPLQDRAKRKVLARNRCANKS